MLDVVFVLSHILLSYLDYSGEQFKIDQTCF